MGHGAFLHIERQDVFLLGRPNIRRFERNLSQFCILQEFSSRPPRGALQNRALRCGARCDARRSHLAARHPSLPCFLQVFDFARPLCAFCEGLFPELRRLRLPVFRGRFGFLRPTARQRSFYAKATMLPRPQRRPQSARDGFSFFLRGLRSPAAALSRGCDGQKRERARRGRLAREDGGGHNPNHCFCKCLHGSRRREQWIIANFSLFAAFVPNNNIFFEKMVLTSFFHHLFSDGVK